MTAKAHRAYIFEVTFSAAFNDRDDVIRIPQTFARWAAQSPMSQQRDAIRSACIAQAARFAKRIDCA